MKRALQWLADLFGVSKVTLLIVLVLGFAFVYLQEIYDFTKELMHAIRNPHP